MRRKDFLKEMYTSLFQTVKYAYEPFIHDDLQKVEEAVDKTLGIDWLPFMKEEEVLSNRLELKIIDGNPIIIFVECSNMQAMSGICPECSNIINVTTLYSTGKCFNCERDYNFKTKHGDLHLVSLPVKKKAHMYYIGLEKSKKPGDLHA